MQDRDYHELGDKDLHDRLARHKPADAKELPQPKDIEIAELPQPAQATVGGTPVMGSAVNVSFSQLPDGRMFFTIELPPTAYDSMQLAERQTLLDQVITNVRGQLAKLWSIA